MNRFAGILVALVVVFATDLSRGQTRPASAPVEQPTSAAVASARETMSRVEQVRANLDAVREILSIGLTNDEAGDLLREARRRSPNAHDVARRVAGRERELANARLERVRLLERRRSSDDPAEIARLTDELAKQEIYVDVLGQALRAERSLLKEATELSALLDRRLLWIGSAPPIGPGWFKDVAEGAAWLTRPEAWLDAVYTLLHRFAHHWLPASLVTILAVILLSVRQRLKRTLAALSEPIGKAATDSFLLTVRASAVTVLLAAPISLLLGSAGALLFTQDLDPFARAIGNGMLAAAAVILLLGFARQMCRPKGLADVHFGWDQQARRTLQLNLSWLLVVEGFAAFVVATCDVSGDEQYRRGIGRLAFMVGSIALTVFVARVFLPGSGVFSAFMSRSGLAWRLRKIWYGLLVLLPAALTIAAGAGYYYTATEVQNRFFSSGVALLAGVVLYSLMSRWLLVTRQRAALQQARQKLAEQREARQKKLAADASGAAAGEAVPELETPTVDIAAASERTVALLRTVVAVIVVAVLWGLWKSVLPALTVLQRVQLTDPTLNADGAVIVDPITLWSLLLGLIALGFSILAARNLPALLELVVLERFSLDAGVRYAVTTLTRYAVIAIGIVVASGLFGIQWARAQWIIAALGVGLGFGLQEIVANFVSGLIILFERPIRVGDTVTVGDVSGTVSRLQIRATTITDWDNKEVLVPNKSFITERVMNWTLSNPITRLLVRVGVAYGTDIERAQKTIAGAVKRVPAVLDEPAPSIFFVGFGESSLDFEVRVFVAELAKRLPTTHELHLAINNALRDATIEIPFPQRDLHFRADEADQA